MSDNWMPDSWQRTIPVEGTIPIEMDALRGAIQDCVTCSMSGHWPLSILESAEFVDALDVEAAVKWLGFRCCGFKSQGIVGYLQRARVDAVG